LKNGEKIILPIAETLATSRGECLRPRKVVNSQGSDELKKSVKPPLEQVPLEIHHSRHVHIAVKSNVLWRCMYILKLYNTHSRVFAVRNQLDRRLRRYNMHIIIYYVYSDHYIILWRLRVSRENRIVFVKTQKHDSVLILCDSTMPIIYVYNLFFIHVHNNMIVVYNIILNDFT